MNANHHSSNRNHQNHAVTGVIGTASAKRRAAPNGVTPAAQVGPVNGEGTVTRIFVFHRGDSGSSSCENLTITAAWNASYSNCRNGIERQYSLNGIERAQLQDWIKQFQPIKYGHTDATHCSTSSQIYLNERSVSKPPMYYL